MSANIWQCNDCGGLHQSLPYGLCPDRDRLLTAGGSKLASYLTQENSVLHERVRKLEIALAKERGANAQIADEVAAKCAGDDDAFTKWQSEAAVRAANSIASLIRGRGET